MKRNTINKELGSLWIFHINNDISGLSQDNLPFSKGTSIHNNNKKATW